MYFPDDDQGEDIATIYKKAQHFQKEYALDTCLRVSHFIKWRIPGKTESRFFISPLIYQSCQISKSKRIEIQYKISVDEETYTINPVLAFYFKQEFDLELPIDVDHPAVFLSQLRQEFEQNGSTQIEMTNHFSESETWQIIEKNSIGIFNYKKSLLGEDYKRIIDTPSSSIQSFLTGDQFSTNKIKYKLIQDLDTSQKAVLDLALKESCVIQGPPGTGKSHTIVSLIGASLAEGQKVLFVSEKRSALEVVYQRLKKLNLHQWSAYFNTEKNEVKKFYADLKKSWDELTRPELIKENQLIEFEKSGLFETYPFPTTSEVPDLIEALLKLGFSPNQLKPNHKTPSKEKWEASEATLVAFEKVTGISLDGDVSETIFLEINRAIFSEKDPIVKLEKRLNEVQDHLRAIEKYIDNPQTSLASFTRLTLAASILSMVNKEQLDLLNEDTKKFRSFNNWAKKYQLAKDKLKRAEKANEKWTKKPSLSEIAELIDLLKHAEAPRGILGFLKRNNSRLIEAFSDFDKTISNEAKLQLLEQLRNEWHLKGEFSELSIKLQHNFGIQNPELEINQIFHLRNKLDAITSNEYLALLNDENSLVKINELNRFHQIIQQVNNGLKFLFQESSEDTIQNIIERNDKILKQLPVLNRYLPQVRDLLELPGEIIDFLRHEKGSIQLKKAKVYYAQLLTETRFNPLFESLSGHNLSKEYSQLKRKRKSQYQHHLEAIEFDRRSALREKEKLVDTPASKLSTSDKDLKKELKSAKRILIHEFNKKQQHLSVKKLMESSAKWLADLRPVWMMNPLSISTHLPCIEEYFDLVIFDESSQIPLEDAIPAIFRAKRVIVVGDSNQMPPGNFFAAKSGSTTLLDEAKLNLKNEMLKWHYRSEHPDLINFSNHAFYDSELISLPPLLNESPIEWFKIDGVFEQGKNIEEAINIAEYTAQKIKEGCKSIAVISFSKEQESEIINQLKKKKIDPDTENILVRNLENVQGIERELVVISFGYGPDSSGNFRLNFGPINQQNGTNRLNVLFTRAIKKMVVFSSVSHTDFGFSDNPGVKLMRDFLYYINHLKDQKSGSFEPNHATQLIIDLVEKNELNVSFYPRENLLMTAAFIQHSTGKVLLVDPGSHPDETKDLYAVLKVLDNRFKEVKIILSKDLWVDFERISHEIVVYFS